QVNTLVSKETLAEMPAIYALARTLRAARWSLFFLVSVGRGTVLNPISVEEADKLLEWLSDRARDGGIVVTTTEAPFFRRVVQQPRHLATVPGAGSPPAGRVGHAGAGIRDGNGVMFIASNGEVSPSGFLPLVAGNVKERDPVAIYRDAPMFTQLRDATDF